MSRELLCHLFGHHDRHLTWHSAVVTICLRCGRLT